MYQKIVFIFLLLGISLTSCEEEGHLVFNDLNNNNDISDRFDSFNNNTDISDSISDVSNYNGYHYHYFYARISATEPAKDDHSENPGPDIDALIINRHGTHINANSVELLTDMSMYPHYKDRDITAAGTTLNAFGEDDPADITMSSTCDATSDNVVSLGGTDAGEAAAIWTFDQEIYNDDTLYVVEVSGCNTSRDTIISEPYKLEISTSTTVDANWRLLGHRIGNGPVTPFRVSLDLPDIPLSD